MFDDSWPWTTRTTGLTDAAGVLVAPGLAASNVREGSGVDWFDGCKPAPDPEPEKEGGENQPSPFRAVFENSQKEFAAFWPHRLRATVRPTRMQSLCAVTDGGFAVQMLGAALLWQTGVDDVRV